MLDFNFYSPTEMVFGKNAEAKLGEYTKKYGGTKVLLVYGSERVVKSGLMATAEKSLAEAVQNYRYQVEAYANALSRIFEKPIKRACLYFFRLNRCVDID